jgi:hypothetical protein
MPNRLTGAEPFRAGGDPLPFVVADFWRWAFSDLVGNNLRGLVAEFLVARALGVADGGRVEWDAVDLRTPDGLSIEVKCSGYLQSWAQAKPSRISFDVGPKRSWDAATNTMATDVARRANVYVFCLHAHRARETLDPLDVAQWEFFVLSRDALDRELGTQARAALSTLLRIGAKPCAYAELRQTIAAARQLLPESAP